MRRLLLVVLLLVVPLFLQAQTSAPADSVAHGSEKVAHEAAHPGSELGGPNEGPRFLGLPAWIFKLINMMLFLGALGYFVGGPAKRALADRQAGIQRAAQEARDRRVKADQVASDIQTRLAQLEEEIQSIRARAETEGERQKRELIAAAEKEAAKILATAQAEVDSKIKNARHELTEYAGQLASDRAEELLRERITEQDQKKIFRESLREVEEVES